MKNIISALFTALVMNGYLHSQAVGTPYIPLIIQSPQFTITSCTGSIGWLGVGLPANSTDIEAKQKIQVNVTSPGPYNFTTANINGIQFSTSGTFTSTGIQDVDLIATGTPINYTVDNNGISYTVTNTTVTNAGNCNFLRKVYIPDQNYSGEIRNTGTSHRFLYKAITYNGREWLQTNLGSKYNKVGDADFNPELAATAINDYKAYGSLFQNGRYSDGHELTNWTSATSPGGLSTSSTLSATPTSAQMDVMSKSGIFYTSTNKSAVFGRAMSVDGKIIVGPGMPCPNGFLVARTGAAGNWVDSDYPFALYNGGAEVWLATSLKLVAPVVYRSAVNGSIVTAENSRRLMRTNLPASYPALSASSPESVISGGALRLGTDDNLTIRDRRYTMDNTDNRGSMDGYPIRCIKPQ